MSKDHRSRRPVMSSSTLLTIFLVFVLSGCATFATNDIQRVQEFPPLPDTAKKSDVEYSMEFVPHGPATFANRQDETLSWLKSDFEKTLRESGYFANVSTSVTQGRQDVLRMNLQMEDSVNGAALIPAVITGLSLYIIPSWYTDEFKVTATATTLDGQKRTYTIIDSMQTWQWLPMAFARSSTRDNVVAAEVIHNMWKSLIVTMQRDGILTRSASARPVQVAPTVTPTKTTAPAPVAKSPDSKDDATARLERLKRMKDRGLISHKDYEQKKKEILDSM